MSIQRVTVSLPSELVDQLDAAASFLGISRSSMVAASLGPVLENVSLLLSSLEAPADGGALDGRSLKRAAYDRLDGLEVMLDSLRSGLGGVRDDVAN